LTQEEDGFEEKLSWVSLSGDNKIVLLNGDKKYSGRLPMDVFRKNKSFDEQISIVESVIYNTCAQYGFDYVSSENVRNCSREVVELFYERQRSSKKKRLGSALLGKTSSSPPITSSMLVVELGPEEQEEVS